MRIARAFSWLFLVAAAAPARSELRNDSPSAVIATVDSAKPEDALRIAPDRLLSHITFLANDSLEGRGTGDDGIDIAAGYIAAHFTMAGLKPIAPGDSYFQNFTIPGEPVLLDETVLTIRGTSGDPVQPRLRTEFTPFAFSAAADFAGEAVFVGYGCTNADKNYDDYTGVDVAGKVVLMLRREPPGWGAEAGGFSNHARFETKVRLAHQKGATAVIIANQKPTEENVDVLMPFGRAGGSSEDIPAIHVRREVMAQILSAGGARSLDELQDQLDATGKNASAALAGVRIEGKVAFNKNDIKAKNVVGLLPGNGPHANEYLVVGGHYDHLGIRRGKIYNGADDNASGTAAVIELAYAFSRVPRRDRGIIFMTFSGEEIGLHGSKHYAKSPLLPIESTVGMINMDMIGRLDHAKEENMLAIQGLGTGGSFRDIVERETAAMGIKYLPDDSAIGPSDHDSFYHAGVPSLFFFTGTHDDYHQPGDDVEKVNVEGGAQIAELVGRIMRGIINAVDAPAYARVDTPAKIFRSSADGGVVMGIVPDMDDSSGERGWRVGQVMPTGGAGKAGMRAGDRIMAIDQHEINGLSDYRDVTREKKPGDLIAVTVKRGTEVLTLNVELSARTR